ncbi:hypothetical protein BEN44_05030 [Leptospira interrogans serovar Ricardi]|nr:hypothetical protein [Leptospira interrogans serovar Ricardi]
MKPSYRAIEKFSLAKLLQSTIFIKRNRWRINFPTTLLLIIFPFYMRILWIECNTLNHFPLLFLKKAFLKKESILIL